MKTEKYQNRLVKEKSPYLLQHAYNPVEWFPWAKEAFEKAQKEDKPIFLSIGYSTCHWCHVMAHESFEDPQMAAFLNKNFVPIKVDREERPDIDSIYMTAVQVIAGQGGWPLSVFLTHDKKPFFGGTYYPPVAKWGTPSFSDVLQAVHTAWTTNRQELLNSSSSLTDLLKNRIRASQDQRMLEEEVLHLTYKQFEKSFDDIHGGFGTAPKFPTSHNLSFLLRYWQKTGIEGALRMTEFTLDKMSQGGMYDHVGGGFHRYSVDQQWQIPHFEKMLYDQATIAKTYLEAYQVTKKETYAQIAREIFDYVLRDLQHTEGGFYSAEDADSLDPYDPASHEKKEGSFYLWTFAHIKELLGKDVEIFNRYYGILEEGNAKSDPHGEFIGKNVLYVEKSLKEIAAEFSMSVEDVKIIIDRSKQKLFDVRQQWPRPHLDDKILVDWNGLMISSLAFGSKVLKDEKYKQAAVKAADFILKHLKKDQRLLHRYRDGEAGIEATLEDYAFFTNALLDLYEATQDLHYLTEASHLTAQMNNLFWDEQNGGFFLTAKDAEELLYRPKEIYDGAVPSGNSLAALVLVRMYHITLDKTWQDRLEKLLLNFSDEIRQHPYAHTQTLMAFSHLLGPSQEIVFSFDKDSQALEQMINELYTYFLPNKVMLFRSSNDTKALISLAPFVKSQNPVGHRPTIYLCTNHICQKPITDSKDLTETLNHMLRVQE